MGSFVLLASLKLPFLPSLIMRAILLHFLLLPFLPNLSPAHQIQALSVPDNRSKYVASAVERSDGLCACLVHPIAGYTCREYVVYLLIKP